jgi:hypothetical protein
VERQQLHQGVEGRAAAAFIADERLLLVSDNAICI